MSARRLFPVPCFSGSVPSVGGKCGWGHGLQKVDRAECERDDGVLGFALIRAGSVDREVPGLGPLSRLLLQGWAGSGRRRNCGDACAGVVGGTREAPPGNPASVQPQLALASGRLFLPHEWTLSG